MEQSDFSSQYFSFQRGPSLFHFLILKEAAGASKEPCESITRVHSLVPLMDHDPDRSWITTDLDLDHPKGTQPNSSLLTINIFMLW